MMKKQLRKKLEQIWEETETGAAAEQLDELTEQMDAEFDRRVAGGQSELDAYRALLGDVDKIKKMLETLEKDADDAEQEAHEKNIKKMNAREKGYTQEELLKSEKDFGLFLLETNDLNKTAQEVFCDYKSRWEIETFYNYIDNTMDFNALYQNDYCCTQGLGFIVQIAGMIFHDVQRAISEKGLSVKDTLFLMKGLKLNKERDRYTVRNENKTRRELCEKFSLNPSNHGVISSPT